MLPSAQKPLLELPQVAGITSDQIGHSYLSTQRTREGKSESSPALSVKRDVTNFFNRAESLHCRGQLFQSRIDARSAIPQGNDDLSRVFENFSHLAHLGVLLDGITLVQRSQTSERYGSMEPSVPPRPPPKLDSALKMAETGSM
jgi:hypothetical protein